MRLGLAVAGRDGLGEGGAQSDEASETGGQDADHCAGYQREFTGRFCDRFSDREPSQRDHAEAYQGDQDGDDQQADANREDVKSTDFICLKALLYLLCRLWRMIRCVTCYGMSLADRLMWAK